MTSPSSSTKKRSTKERKTRTKSNASRTRTEKTQAESEGPPLAFYFFMGMVALSVLALLVALLSM